MACGSSRLVLKLEIDLMQSSADGLKCPGEIHSASVKIPVP